MSGVLAKGIAARKMPTDASTNASASRRSPRPAGIVESRIRPFTVIAREPILPFASVPGRGSRTRRPAGRPPTITAARYSGRLERIAGPTSGRACSHAISSDSSTPGMAKGVTRRSGRLWLLASRLIDSSLSANILAISGNCNHRSTVLAFRMIFTAIFVIHSQVYMRVLGLLGIASVGPRTNRGSRRARPHWQFEKLGFTPEFDHGHRK